MVKINTLISKNVDVQSKLVENNLDLENEFKAKLKVYIIYIYIYN